MKEAEIQNRILEWFMVNGYARKIHTTAIPDPARKGGFRRNPSRGVSDLVGVFRAPCPHCGGNVGRFLAVEVKKPGGRVTPSQRIFLDCVRQAGGLAVLAHSLATASARVESQLAEERARLSG